MLFAKPVEPGKVKTRLIGELTAAQAAALHGAFLDDLTERLRRGRFNLRLAWACESTSPLPRSAVPGFRQLGEDLGERLFNGLAEMAGSHEAVAAIGSDHPEIPLSLVHRAFDKLATGTEAVLGPVDDGGYYLIALQSGAVHWSLFEDIPWSSAEVLETTLTRCRRLNLQVDLLPAGNDVDTPSDLDRLCRRLRLDSRLDCPRTRALLRSWERL